MIVNTAGKIQTSSSPNISTPITTLLNGVGVYETLRTYHRVPFRLEEHLERLMVSARLMGIVSEWNGQTIREQLNRTIVKQRFGESKVRIILTPQDFIITVEQLEEKPRQYYQRGVSLVSYRGVRFIPEAKKIADTVCSLAHAYAEQEGAYDAVLVGTRGQVSECAYANIFWVRNGVLLTTNKNILFGITRQIVIELAKGCRYAPVTSEGLLKADEVFITQTTSGILPVHSIDGELVGTGRPGPMTKALIKQFRALTA